MSTHVSRRRFLSSAAALSVASALPGRAFASRVGGQVFTNASTAAYTQGILTQAHFENLVGTLFLAFLEKDKVAYMRLVSVEAQKTKAKRNSVRAFHLSFSTGGVVVPQDSYLIDHGRLGRFALFMTPGIASDGSPTCSAIFASLT